MRPAVPGSVRFCRLRPCLCVFQRTKREWRPLEDRSCTDLPWFLLFTVFCVGMVTEPEPRTLPVHPVLQLHHTHPPLQSSTTVILQHVGSLCSYI